MTTRRNFSSPSLVTQLLFFARSVPVYLPCYIPPLVQNKRSVGEWEKEPSAWTPLHKNYNSRQSTDGQLCLVSSFLKRDWQTGLEKTRRRKLEKLKLSPTLHYSRTLPLEISTHGHVVPVTALQAAGPEDCRFSTFLGQEHPHFQEASLHLAAAQGSAGLAGLPKAPQLWQQAENVCPHLCFSTKHQAQSLKV